MELIDAVFPLAAMMLATGIVAGLLAGLLGVGGGIVIVPVLDTALGLYGIEPAIRMHVAVATSLTCIIFTSISSTRAHHAKGAVDLGLVKVWGPAVLMGSLLGAIGAAFVDSQVLSAVFGVVALLVALKMLLPLDNLTLSRDVPRGLAAPFPPLAIGGLSSMMGIGGGTLSVPVLTLMNQPIHRAVGTAALFGLLISLPGAFGFAYSGWGDARLPPGSLGYINLIGVALIAPVTVVMAPLGAKLAHRLDKRRLSMLFGFFLLLVAGRMLYRTLLA
ncbi:sulfite exporter TauE/SafE family protein [Bowmanella yangjiangensis]|uniref:Probable membrane transporter protein n=1 Tax=Bowmanella yangjiangensis TaxID=2811230 RepID=A0ABS3CT39_9ALTE|nr:sulfite exporter TauE/SafE family protein [Bowmanella yangjiangensis]MBN7819674.1 sulfite exporter TauE/SafE family protein [Bowmanella yangjiangensis]